MIFGLRTAAPRPFDHDIFAPRNASDSVFELREDSGNGLLLVLRLSSAADDSSVDPYDCQAFERRREAAAPLAPLLAALPALPPVFSRPSAIRLLARLSRPLASCPSSMTFTSAPRVSRPRSWPHATPCPLLEGLGSGSAFLRPCSDHRHHLERVGSAARVRRSRPRVARVDSVCRFTRLRPRPPRVSPRGGRASPLPFLSFVLPSL